MSDRLPWEPSGKPRTMKRAGMVIDLRRCIGCHACSVSCKTEHDVALGVFRTRVRYLEKPGATQIAFLPLLCNHCQDAPCIPACPTDAMTRKEDGRVVVDHDKCEGNMDCIAACPYDAIQLDPQTGIADKCDLCTHRTDVGMDPACVAACPNASASLFVSAKISQFTHLPQGKVERRSRALLMVEQMDAEGFGDCSNHAECQAVCPKEIDVSNIATMRREFFKAAIRP